MSTVKFFGVFQPERRVPCSGTHLGTVHVDAKMSSLSVHFITNNQSQLLKVFLHKKKHTTHTLIISRVISSFVRRFWMFVDEKSGWVCLGCGLAPKRRSVIFSARLKNSSIASRSNLMSIESFGSASLIMQPDTRNHANTLLKQVMLNQDKFYPNGKYRHFPGVSVIVDLPYHLNAHTVMRHTCNLLKSNDLTKDHFTFLPSNSYHMTLCDLFAGDDWYRITDLLTCKPQGSFMQAAKILKRTAYIPRDTRIKMRAKCLHLSDSGILRMELEPWNCKEREQIEQLRMKISLSAGAFNHPISPPYDPCYKLHMSIAYAICPLGFRNETTQAMETVMDEVNSLIQSLGPIELRAPYLSFFFTMSKFSPV